MTTPPFAGPDVPRAAPTGDFCRLTHRNVRPKILTPLHGHVAIPSKPCDVAGGNGRASRIRACPSLPCGTRCGPRSPSLRCRTRSPSGRDCSPFDDVAPTAKLAGPGRSHHGVTTLCGRARHPCRARRGTPGAGPYNLSTLPASVGLMELRGPIPRARTVIEHPRLPPEL